jgi:hypothetical protein
LDESVYYRYHQFLEDRHIKPYQLDTDYLDNT